MENFIEALQSLSTIRRFKDYIRIFLLEITIKYIVGYSFTKKEKINSVAHTKAPRLTPEGNKLCQKPFSSYPEPTELGQHLGKDCIHLLFVSSQDED